MELKTPCPFTVHHALLITATAKDWEKWEKETTDYNQELMKKHNEKTQALKKLIDDASKIFGNHHKIIRYLKKQSPTHPWQKNLADVRRAVQEIINAARLATAREEAINNHIALAAEAIIYLTAKGKKMGIDFTAKDAITQADEIAFQEEVEFQKKKGGPFDFSGKNCEDCDGWDGESKRCNCGNRRVDWVKGLSHSFKKPYAQGEAY